MATKFLASMALFVLGWHAVEPSARIVNGCFACDGQPTIRVCVNLPFKQNASRRHRTGKVKFIVMKWPEYETDHCGSGRLTVWMKAELVDLAVAESENTQWPATHSDVLTETNLTAGGGSRPTSAPKPRIFRHSFAAIQPGYHRSRP